MTPEEVNALPEKVRQYISDLATISDPAGMVQEIAGLKDQVAELVETRATALREHANKKLEEAAIAVSGLREDGSVHGPWNRIYAARIVRSLKEPTPTPGQKEET